MERAPRVGRHNVPEPLTSLVGRDDDRRRVSQLVREQRVVTLVGVGGVGKTRLALAAARAVVADFAHGVWLVELAALADDSLVPLAVAAAVGTTLDRNQRPLDALVAALGARQLLVVLDNCEHLVAACAEVVERVAGACPRVHILATSREPLGVAGEVVWPVAPLAIPPLVGPLPGLQQFTDTASVRLFVERARTAHPEFAATSQNAAAVARICGRLDGLPLALELAAARMRVLSPEQLAERIDDRFQLLVGGPRSNPARQQTLEATVRWSYDLLDDQDRRLFERLSMFTGGFSLDAVEAVCGPNDCAPVLDGLARLVDTSMLIARDVEGEQRFAMLETLGDFGRRRLHERGEDDEMHRRLAEWVLARAEQAEQALRGPDQARWLRWAELEHDNVRSTLAWSMDSGETDTVLRVAGSLWWAWLLHDRWIETEEWLDNALSLTYGTTATIALARTLHGAGTTAAFRGKYVRAQTYLDESVAVAHELGDLELVLAGHSAFALLRQFQGDIDASQQHVHSMLQLAEQLDRPWYAARAAEFIASRALERGDLSEAANQLTRGVRLARDAGDQWNLAMLLSHLGDVERMRGTHPRAAPLYEESIRLFERLGLPADPSRVHNLAYVALAQQHTAHAESRFHQALDGFERQGDPRGVADCILGLGCVRAAERRPSEAARLFGAGDAALARLGSMVWPSNRADYQHWLRIVQGALGEQAWHVEYTTGGLLGPEGALEATRSSDAAVNRPSRVSEDATRLTRREREVAQLAAQGLSNRRIAETLVIAEKTAANHLQSALEKLEVHSRSQLAARAVELGLAPNPSQ
jgi:predicted ATPase/DNA-binding CsgD family transcriptional regulator